MKNFTTILYKIFIICLLGLFLTNCEGEDGENGINGANGTNGINGTNGENGVGFDELIKYGSIKLTLTGTRPDDVAFTNTAEFKFTPIRARYNSFYKNETSIEFETTRFLSVPDGLFQRSNTNFTLFVKNPGTENEVIDFFNLHISRYSVVSEDLTHFEINNEKGYSNKGEGISNFSITNYSFNNETNNLIFSFSFNVGAAYNNTRKDLSVSGEVNMIVLKSITPFDR